MELGRAQLAADDSSAAEGSLRRALELGAQREVLIVPLVDSLLRQDRPQEAVALVGDPGSWPAPLRFPLAALRAESELNLIGMDRRSVTRDFVTAFRLAPASGDPLAKERDVIAAASRLDRLRTESDVARSAHEHFACRAAAGQPERKANPFVESEADRRVIQVGPNRTVKSPSAAAAIAGEGDIVLIDGADYPGDVAVWNQSGLLLRGVQGRPHLDSKGRSAANQGIWVFNGNDITVENMEFSGARSITKNGSGIRFKGRNLTVRDSVFHDNEDGVLTWNGPESDVLIERSVFYRNGYGDGQSHNIYVGKVRKFTLRFSHSHDSHVGHEVKSRARTNFILYNRITDEDDGDSSYLIDLPEGGDAWVIGNVLLKGLRAENPNAISYASEAPDVATGQLWVVNNSFYNRRPDATFVRNRSQRPATLVNNVVSGAPALVLSGKGTEVSNYSALTPGLRDPANLDFSLTAESPLIDAGADVASRFGKLAVADFEYVHPASGRRRKHIGPTDIGATEFCGW